MAHVFQRYWVDQPPSERIAKDLFGAEGLCEAIRRDDPVVGSYLISHVLSFHDGHVAMATNQKRYEMLGLFLDHGWAVNAGFNQWQPSVLS